MSGLCITTYRHALHPFFERAGRGTVKVCPELAKLEGIAGGGCSCGVGCDIPKRAYQYDAHFLKIITFFMNQVRSHDVKSVVVEMDESVGPMNRYYGR
jgi:hypothetical protein